MSAITTIGTFYGCRLDLADDQAELVLLDGDRGNPLGCDLSAAIVEALEQVPFQARALLIRSEGRSFCVGGKIDDFAGHEGRAEKVAAIVDTVHAVIRKIRRLPIPSISVINGWAAGGGIGFGLSADIVICGRSARFRPAYARVGLAPDCGTSWHLIRAFGMHRASRLLLTSTSDFTAEAAMSVGLVSEIVDDEQLLERARIIGEEIASGPRESLQLIRKAVHSAVDISLDDHLDQERAGIIEAAGTSDADEGIAAFLTRRAPHFGRGTMRDAGQEG